MELDRTMENRSVEDEGVELAVFTARIGSQRQIAEKLRIEFATGKRVRQNFRIDTGGDGAKFVHMKVADRVRGYRASR